MDTTARATGQERERSSGPYLHVRLRCLDGCLRYGRRRRRASRRRRQECRRRRRRVALLYSAHHAGGGGGGSVGGELIDDGLHVHVDKRVSCA